MKEYRTSPRYACHLKAHFETENGFEYGDVRNLSSGGFFLATETLMDAGRQFSVEITKEQEEAWIKGTCEVVWVNDIETKDFPEWIFESKILEGISPCQLFKGVGVRFIDIPPDQVERLEKYLRILEAQ